MNHLDYYNYQASARGIESIADVERIARNHAHFYDQIVKPWLPTDPQVKIVELACGHGSFLSWLRERGRQAAIGIDSSPEQVRFARLTGAEVHDEDALQWLARQPAASVGILVAIDFLEHISKDQAMDLLHQSRRVLVPGGRLILRYPNGSSPLVGFNLFNDITHVWTYTVNCLETLGRMHGFSAFRFVDENVAAIRDHRWLKVPINRCARWLLGTLVFCATRERVNYWSPHMWACLETPSP